MASWKNITIKPQQLISGLTLLFPLGIFALEKFGASNSWSLALAALAITLHIDWKHRKTRLFQFVLLAAVIAPIAALHPTNLPRLYPFLVSATVLMFFVRTNGSDASALEVFASAVAKIDDQKKTALRKSMPFWIWGLSINTVILFVFLFGFSTDTWALYAGFISYLFLIGLFLLTVFRVHFRSGGPHVA